jgi:hypothetical protein
MVFNRLCDPDSKLGVLRWLQTVSTRVRHQPPQVLDLYRSSLLACHYNKDI